MAHSGIYVQMVLTLIEVPGSKHFGQDLLTVVTLLVFTPSCVAVW